MIADRQTHRQTDTLPWGAVLKMKKATIDTEQAT